ncbi:MAG TPA: efflux RND transporter periplasmic adaptor subunit [Verrucomicrobiae bacterium]|nr:efflux RND transporter periplasmic adaptor subunit [Verrucomicrobiae bacterium]
MKRKIALSTFIVVIMLASLAGIKLLQIQTLMAAGESFTAPPETVSSAIAREQTWQETLAAIGSISAVQGVTITPEVAGTVSEIAFESGAMVKKGDLLIRLDTSTEEAQLRAIEAQANLARINAERMRQLRSDNTVSQSEVDTSEATLKQAQANADAVRAAIQKKTLRAPFGGQLGIRQVNLGEYVETGKPIVSLQSLAPVYADFSLPQQELSRLKPGMKVRVTTDTYSKRQFDGVLTAINPDLQASTRSIRLQATLENAEQLLRPGMFARVEVLLPVEQKVLIIPATSILSAPYGDSVYVIEKGTNSASPGLVVRQQFVRTGRALGDFVSVETGLQPGTKVAASGVFKLRNGMAVAENNDIAPPANEAPRPPDR